jgi:hypothetical protein
MLTVFLSNKLNIERGAGLNEEKRTKHADEILFRENAHLVDTT